MNVIIHSSEKTPFDTSDTIELRRSIKELEHEQCLIVQTINNIISHKRRELVEKLLEQRPIYPTDAQVKGIKQIAEFIQNGTEYGDHLGYSRRDEEPLPIGVRYSSKYRLIIIDDYAPYVGCGKLWEITPEEKDAIAEILEGLGMSITGSWYHQDGISFRITH